MSRLNNYNITGSLGSLCRICEFLNNKKILKYNMFADKYFEELLICGYRWSFRHPCSFIYLSSSIYPGVYNVVWVKIPSTCNNLRYFSSVLFYFVSVRFICLLSQIILCQANPKQEFTAYFLNTFSLKTDACKYF